MELVGCVEVGERVQLHGRMCWNIYGVISFQAIGPLLMSCLKFLFLSKIDNLKKTKKTKCESQIFQNVSIFYIEFNFANIRDSRLGKKKLAFKNWFLKI